MNQLYEFRVRYSITDDVENWRRSARKTLHNDADPCHQSQRMKHFETERIGADIDPDDADYRLCNTCRWGAPISAVTSALRRPPEGD